MLTSTRAPHRDRVLFALVAVLGVLALLFTIYWMCHPQPEPHSGMSAPPSTATFAAPHALAHPTESIAGSLDPATSREPSDSARSSWMCAVLGVSCMFVLLALVVRALLVRPILNCTRTPRTSGGLVKVPSSQQSLSIRPSLIEFSISRT